MTKRVENVIRDDAHRVGRCGPWRKYLRCGQEVVAVKIDPEGEIQGGGYLNGRLT